MFFRSIQLIVILCLADFVLTSIVNGTKEGGLNNLLEARRNVEKFARRQRARSTSSSSGDNDKESKEDGESLGMTSESSSSSEIDHESKTRPRASKEQTGWRKWHRKCPPCPEDMRMKWRDPRIKWICGAYQSARRSFKSLCMMHYRNCQDGTMFTKIRDHRCDRESVPGHRLGEHFFYDYKAKLEDDSSNSDESSSTDEDSISSV